MVQTLLTNFSGEQRLTCGLLCPFKKTTHQRQTSEKKNSWNNLHVKRSFKNFVFLHSNEWQKLNVFKNDPSTHPTGTFPSCFSKHIRQLRLFCSLHLLSPNWGTQKGNLVSQSKNRKGKLSD